MSVCDCVRVCVGVDSASVLGSTLACVFCVSRRGRWEEVESSLRWPRPSVFRAWLSSGGGRGEDFPSDLQSKNNPLSISGLRPAQWKITMQDADHMYAEGGMQMQFNCTYTPCSPKPPHLLAPCSPAFTNTQLRSPTFVNISLHSPPKKHQAPFPSL